MEKSQLLEKTRILLQPFKVYGKPANEVFSDGQCEIAGSIIFKVAPRIACLAPTGYGKSEAVACGVILRSIIKRENFIIASVKFGTADIIMDKVIEHLFDDEFLTYQLELEKGLRLDRLKRDRKKTAFSYREGGGIKIVSLHGKEDDLSKVIGVHAPNIILDESPLLTPAKYFQVLKILEGTGSYEDSFLFELGNAVNRNHFMRNVTNNPNYYKINIGLEQAISEGRLDRKSVEEKLGMPFFEQFYLNEFPEEDDMDDKGYRRLLTENEVSNAMVDSVEDEDDKKLGMDVAGGGDFNTFTVRGEKYAKLVRENKSKDTMVNISEMEAVMDEEDIIDHDIFIDDIGIGRGVSDRAKELGHDINSISVGMKPEEEFDKEKFFNLKALAYWGVREWIKGGGKLLRNPNWYQLCEIKYKINSDKTLQIEPKEDMKKRTGKSPDHAESLMLTFAPSYPVDLSIL